MEIHPNKNNFNKNGGFILSQAWSPVTNMLMNVKARPSGAGTKYLTPSTIPLVSPPAMGQGFGQVYHDADGTKG